MTHQGLPILVAKGTDWKPRLSLPEEKADCPVEIPDQRKMAKMIPAGKKKGLFDLFKYILKVIHERWQTSEKGINIQNS